MLVTPELWVAEEGYTRGVTVQTKPTQGQWHTPVKFRTRETEAGGSP